MNVTTRNLNTKSEAQAACVICGSPLDYSEYMEEQVCHICGKTFSSNIRCMRGHYVCDHCHRGDVLNHMEELLIKSVEKNPVRLAEMHILKRYA